MNPRSLFPLAAALASAACSLTVVDADPCASDEQCADLFGAGSVCGASGYCEQGEASESSLCEANDDCLAASGFGSTCALPEDTEAGSCEAIVVPSRCTRSVPADLKDSPSTYSSSVVVGVLSDQSVQSHRDRENAIELAARHINENSGLGDVPLGILFCDIGEGNAGGFSDGLARPDAAASVTEWMVNVAGLPAVIGAPSSNDTQLIFEDVVNKPDVRGNSIVVSSSATDPSLTDFDVPARGAATDNNPGLLWRTSGDGTAQIDVLVEDMEDLGVTNVAVVREQSPFAGTQLATGGSFAQSFLDSWSGEGTQLTYAGGSPSARDQKILEASAGIADGTYDAILIVGPTKDAQAALSTLSNDDTIPDGVPVYFDAAGSNDELFDGIDETRLFASVRAARPLLSESTELNAFESSYQSAFGNPARRSTFTAEAYDALWFIAAGAVWAIEQGDTVRETESGLPIIRGEDIARGMRKTTSGTAVSFVPSDWPKVLSQFRAGRSIDVSGAANVYSFNLGDEQAPASASIVVGSEQGQFVEP